MTTWPATQKFVAGSTVGIACSAVAYPPPTYAWRYGDSGQMLESVKDSGRGDVPLENLDRVRTDHEGLLTISNATHEDAGRWECIATNQLGVGSDVAVLEYIGIGYPLVSECNKRLLHLRKTLLINAFVIMSTCSLLF